MCMRTETVFRYDWGRRKSESLWITRYVRVCVCKLYWVYRGWIISISLLSFPLSISHFTLSLYPNSRALLHRKYERVLGMSEFRNFISSQYSHSHTVTHTHTHTHRERDRHTHRQTHRQTHTHTHTHTHTPHKHTNIAHLKMSLRFGWRHSR